MSDSATDSHSLSPGDAESRAAALIAQWGLTPVSEVMRTQTSLLVPVVRNSTPLMLKIATDPEEAIGINALAWWQGSGAVRVYEQTADAILMERPTGSRSLANWADSGQDDEATGTLCKTIAVLHGVDQSNRPPGLVSLRHWFAALLEAQPEVALLRAGKRLAFHLLDDQIEERVLHGDMHHENVLDGEGRGWLAIDPKGLYGDRAFDYVNLLRNPLSKLPLQPGRFARTVDVICAASGVERSRLLAWTVAFCCLSAIWLTEDGDEPELDLAIARLAADELRL